MVQKPHCSLAFASNPACGLVIKLKNSSKGESAASCVSQACVVQISHHRILLPGNVVTEWEFSYTQGFNCGKVEVERQERRIGALQLKSTFPTMKLKASGMNIKCQVIPQLLPKPVQRFSFSAHQPGSEDVASCCFRGTPSAADVAGAFPVLGMERWR